MLYAAAGVATDANVGVMVLGMVLADIADMIAVVTAAWFVVAALETAAVVKRLMVAVTASTRRFMVWSFYLATNNIF